VLTRLISNEWRLEHAPAGDPAAWTLYTPNDSDRPLVKIPVGAIKTRAALWGWLVQAGVGEDDADRLSAQAPFSA
jgi:hypothetical protein